MEQWGFRALTWRDGDGAERAGLGRRRAWPLGNEKSRGIVRRRVGRAGDGSAGAEGCLSEKSPRKVVLSGYLLQGGAPLPPSPPLAGVPSTPSPLLSRRL